MLSAGAIAQAIASQILFTSGTTSTSDRLRPVVSVISRAVGKEADMACTANGRRHAVLLDEDEGIASEESSRRVGQEGGRFTVKEVGGSLNSPREEEKTGRDGSRASLSTLVSHYCLTPTQNTNLRPRR